MFSCYLSVLDCSNPNIIPIRDKIEAPFEWHSAICLAKDASDATFDKSLYDALPEVSEVDLIDFDLQGFMSAISPSWTSLRTLAESILQRKDFSKLFDDDSTGNTNFNPQP
jgi:hypothetical protein